MTHSLTAPVAVATLHTSLQAPAMADAFNAATRDRWGNSKTRADRRNRLIAFQGNLCPACGESLEGKRVELAHLIPATFHGAANKVHAGFIWGNIIAECSGCNDAQGDNVVELSDLKRGDLVFIGTTRDLPLSAR